MLQALIAVNLRPFVQVAIVLTGFGERHKAITPVVPMLFPVLLVLHSNQPLPFPYV
jgi:hypothetical protein